MWLRYIHPKLNKWYDSIQLNWGIKRLLGKFFGVLQYQWFVSIDNKIVYPVFRLIEGYINTRIIYHYGAGYRWGDSKSQNIDFNTHNLGYGSVHHTIIRSQRPKRILCLGSMYGFIPYMMARACMENGIGHVDFVDAGYDINSTDDKKRHFYGQGFWRNTNLKKHFSYLLSPKYITTYVMTCAEFAKKYHYKYDYIYFDADHSYKGAMSNLKLFWSRLNKEGFLCIHDIDFKVESRGVTFEHWKFWNEMVEKTKYKFKLTNHYSGIGFVQKMGGEKV